MTKNKKGSITLLFTFFVIAGIVILVTSVIAPMGSVFASKSYQMGEYALKLTNSSLEGISDATVKATLQGQIKEATDSASNNITIATDLYQYSWIWVLVITAMVLFLLSRRITEFGGQII